MAGKKWLVLLLVLVFCLGIGLGMLAERLLGAGRTLATEERPRRSRRDYREVLAERLGLSAEQQAQLTVVLEEQRARYEEVQAYIGPRLAELRKATAARIDALLTEEQRREFEKLRARERKPAEDNTASEEPEGTPKEKAP